MLKFCSRLCTGLQPLKICLKPFEFYISTCVWHVWRIWLVLFFLFFHSASLFLPIGSLALSGRKPCSFRSDNWGCAFGDHLEVSVLSSRIIPPCPTGSFQPAFSVYPVGNIQFVRPSLSLKSFFLSGRALSLWPFGAIIVHLIL